MPHSIEQENKELIRLTPREWLAVLAIVLAVFLGLPRVWPAGEKLPQDHDARVPYQLGNDYWNYARWSRTRGTASELIAVLGDSVVWGHYVRGDETLPAQLNRQLRRHQFDNLGVDGIHPAAMAGLVRYYGQAISGGRVLLQCNPLWMTSPRRDLQGDKEDNFNHPALVPQFRPWLRCYAASLEERLGVVVGHHLGFLQWVRHLEIAHFDAKDLPGWTYEHPYQCLAARLVRPAEFDAAASPEPQAQPWTLAGSKRVTFPWLDLAISFQWKSLEQTIELLRRRGNEVFVLVGPFNEHLLSPASRTAYEKLKRQIDVRLDELGIAHSMAELLPSPLYADASHPLAEGYARLAEQLLADSAFQQFAR